MIYIEKSIDIKNEYMLKYAVENGMLDIQTLQQQINMERRKKYLEKHQYKIWEGKDGKYYTYLLDDSLKKRVLKKRKTLKDIEDLVVSFYKEQENNPTIQNVFEEWLNKRLSQQLISKATWDRYKRQFNQCCETIKNNQITKMTEADVEDFLLESINQYELTSKAYGNLKTIIYGTFKLAKKKKLIDYSITEVIHDMDISQKLFAKNKKSNEQEVFTEEELPIVLKYLSENTDLINLGLLLIFKTGLRIGELVALQKEDIHSNGSVISVNKTEIIYKNEETGKNVYEIRNYPKTEAGIRNIVIPKSSLWILKKIRSISPFGTYLFEKNGEHIRTYIFRNRIHHICNKLEMVSKSPHKIRKTYGTILIDSGEDESFIIDQMGHTDIRTTKGHYYKNRKSVEKKIELINRVNGL